MKSEGGGFDAVGEGEGGGLYPYLVAEAGGDELAVDGGASLDEDGLDALGVDFAYLVYG